MDTSLDVDSGIAMLRSCACLGFRKASRSVTQFYDRFLSPCELRSTQLIVLLQAYVLGFSNPRTLADELSMDTSTLTRNLKPLTARRLIRTVTGHRGRSKTIEVTRLGRRKLLSAAPLWNKAQDALGERLGYEHLARILAELRRVDDVLRQRSDLRAG